MAEPTTSLERHQQSLLLPFQRHLLSLLVPAADAHHDSGNALMILARGLGIRSVISTLLKVYQSPEQLVLVVNANAEEERGLSEEVGLRMKVVGYEMPVNSRVELYKSGGLLSITSRILVVDMLTNKIPVALLTGLVILHAETVTPTSTEAFIVRIFRNMNKTGFIKAFSDQPEAFTFGVSPLQTIMMQLKLREVHIIPRFHEDVNNDLKKRKADVVELYQPLSETMKDIQTAVIECMEATLSEIKRSNAYLEIDDLTVENALFKSFDSLVRRQLDSVWHKVGPKTRGLVADLTQLRKLQAYLLDFDCVSFNRFLDTVLTAQNTTKGGYENKNKSPWLFTTAGDTIFNVAKARAYRKVAVMDDTKDQEKEKDVGGGLGKDKGKELAVEDEIDLLMEENIGWEMEMDDDAEEAMAEIEGVISSRQGGAVGSENGKGKEKVKEETEEEKEERERRERLKKRLKGLPKGVEPVLEEQPKWLLLKDVLAEIEEELYWNPVDPNGVSNDTILVMCGSSDICGTLREYLSTSTDADGAADMMSNRLRDYFDWKATVGKMHRNLNGKKNWNQRQKNVTLQHGKVIPTAEGAYESAAMKRKREFKRGQAPSNKRRRVRGGGAVGASSSPGREATPKVFETSTGADADALETEATALADIMESTSADASAPSYMLAEGTQQEPEAFSEIDFNQYFGLLSNEDLVILRPYSGDEDDRVLEELRPKYIVLYDPDPSFVRRIEAYRAAHAGLAVRVYFLMYKDSVEEQRYLSTIRKEKDAFERLIREKGTMAIPHEAEYRPGEESETATLRTFNSRAAGGRVAKTGPSIIVVDVREFRSTLPSLLHAGSFHVEPTTISVGDYIITPEMCVERKSLPDLISSFNSGRLYQQCEQMTAHYKQPILLIEFDEKKSFNMDTYAEPKGGKGAGDPSTEADLRAKLVLLTISFPRLCIIWSSSPYETVEIFRDLKENRDEPDVEKAVSVGLDEAAGGAVAEGTGEAGLAFTAQELLRNLPGISTANYRYVMNKVDNIEALCELPTEKVQELIGIEKGKTLFNFLHKDVRSTMDLYDEV